MKRLALVLLLLPIVDATPLVAQANRGTISALVVGGDGSPLPGVTMDVTAPDTLTRRTVFTSDEGVAVASALDPSRSYTVTFSLEGFNTVEQTDVTVRAGQTTNLRATLNVGVSETIQVTGEAPLVDVTNALTGQDITLELTESLPTGRSYQSYLQLVPGVLPDSQKYGGNPASRSGVNYSDSGGEVGGSTDNFYYIEGIHVTDAYGGGFDANLNTEIIQEQSVLTGGLPAEYAGAPGLISNVLTKSGGNRFSGSVNYYYQDDSLVAANQNQEDATFSTYDAAATFGGPIARDRAWFFTSLRKLGRDEDVVNNDGLFLRTVQIKQEQAFGKVTWTATPSTLIAGIYLTDPADVSGSLNPTISAARDISGGTGGHRSTGRLTQVWRSFLGEIAYAKHESDDHVRPRGPAPKNDVTFLFPFQPTAAQEQLGNSGFHGFRTGGTESIQLSGEASFDTSLGSHAVKAGVEASENKDYRNETWTDETRFVSLSNRYLGQGVTAADIADAGTIVYFDPFSASDVGGLNDLGCVRHPSQCAPYDTNHDGVLSQEEAAVIVFDSTAGNPDGQINYRRNLLVQVEPRTVHSEGEVFYLQDTWQMARWAVNAGVRAETWEHFASSGESIHEFVREIAPRVSVAYDVRGEGRRRLSAYYGRYYDPIRTNMTDFAGTLTGNVYEEQLWVSGDWATFRVRGGAQVPDALFAPTTRTPYTDEWQIGYKVDLGRNMSFEANLIRRETRDVLEDYDMHLYAFGSDGIEYYSDLCDEPGCIHDPDSLWLGPEYFGFSAGTVPPSNFVIATLAGGERNWEGVELIFRKRYSNHWQLIASYSRNDAEGSSNSDSSADFQGDVEWLDPRSPNQYNTQPGLIENLFKIAGSYRWDNGLEIGGQYRWNDGVHTSRTWRIYGRNLPCLVHQSSCGNQDLPVFAFAGITDNWIAPDSVGQLDNPSYGILDLRLSWELGAGDRGDVDLFVDIFNALDDQKATRNQDVVSGNGGVAFGEGLEFVEPRRYYLGARLRF